MLTSLEIENFKCFRHLKIEPLAKVNLIVGTSNTGKTAVLEAIDWLPRKDDFVWSRFRDPSIANVAQDEYFRWAFHNIEDAHSRILIAAQESRNLNAPIQTILKLRGDPRNLVAPDCEELTILGALMVGTSLNGRKSKHKTCVVGTTKLPAAELAKDYDRWTLRAENDDRFVQFLKQVDSRLKSFRPMEHTGTRMLYADIGLPERIALPMLGEGFNRLVQVFGSIIGEKADIVLIDEIENGLHWSALPQIWTGIRAAVTKEDVQIFATTHSLECIATAVEAFKGEPKNDLAVHRLERRDDGEVHCVTMNEDELERMLDRGWEVR